MERPSSTLDDLLAQLQQRYGPGAARRGTSLPQLLDPPTLPTGYAALDAALPAGGLPRGRLVELVGPRSAGATTLALSAVAQAQRTPGALAGVLDLQHSFDPPTAQALGVDLDRLVLLRPDDGDAALAVHTLLARRALAALVVDSLPRWLALPNGPRSLATLLHPLPRLLAQSDTLLLVLNPLPTGLLPDPAAAPAALLAPLAALRLRLAPAGWLRRGPEIVGVRSRVAVLAPPFDHPHATLLVELPLARPEAQP